jgi:hypothetical protein
MSALPQATPNADSTNEVLSKTSESPANPVVEIAKDTPTPSTNSDSTSTSEDKKQTIVNETMRLKHRDFWSSRFEIRSDQQNARITGTVRARGGIKDDVVLMIVDDRDFRNFSSGNSSPSYERVRVLGTRNIYVNLKPGVYHVVLSNLHAKFFRKFVDVRLYLEYD